MKRINLCRGESSDSPKGEPKGSPLRFGLLLALALATTIFTLVPSIVEGAVPKLINFQGILKDGSGNPVANASYSVTFTIYNAPSGGINLWSETQSVTTTSGLFAVLLGSTTPVPDTAFKGADRYLGLAVSPDPEMTPRQRLVSVGYSYRVNSVDSASGGTITSKVSIGPGHVNTGVDAFVAGVNNRARGAYSVVGGGGGAAPFDSNSALGDLATIGGGRRNTASGNFATVGGGEDNNASFSYATVGGGSFNSASRFYATVGGGEQNTASGDFATVGGGYSNSANGAATVGGGNDNTASGTGATVGGGQNNNARGQYSVVAGGGGATAADSNSALGDNSTIGGGIRNRASGFRATVGGGEQNTASGPIATVGGGGFNTASNSFATVGGGSTNAASSLYATVGGGAVNAASGDRATVGGGERDTASGPHATVPGGLLNVASGSTSFAAGARAKALHSGTFVWSEGTTFSSTGVNQFLISAPGGVGIGTNSPAKALQIGAAGTPNSEGMIRLESRSGTDAAQRNWEIGVPETDGNLSGKGYSFVIDDVQLGTDPEFLVKFGTGNVGIGTTAPAALLHVNGTAGNGTGVWSTVSDRRLKTEIQPIQSALKTVEALQGVSFRWKDGKKDAEFGRVRGLIAQDVEKVLPEWVKTDPDGYKRLEPIGIDALLIEAIKELKAENVELKNRISELEKGKPQAKVEE